ncbi:GNAT family N-acetyltransferase [Metabacillus litoralis]|uniref:GNAT family N-acetyltransferase n=1 Tax=Metabacillus litoralis TaxID=152268 RepID=UPI002042476A|nr:GNAT family N-acetyltransferase [Metabacillus litoralis]MCM3655362.1 GNAT family N-acetyltransferase [Metabacillus litoralis]
MGIRLATKEDLKWVNEHYRKVGFVPSNLENETVAIVTYKNEYAGIGRIVYLHKEEAELGGIYIVEEFRGLSLANELVEYLVKETNKRNLKRVYCLPFEKLKNFYEKFGFKEFDLKEDTINRKVLKKHQWCRENYDENVLLLKL